MACFQGARYGEAEVVEVQRFGQEFISAFLERRHRLLNAAEGGDHQKRGRRLHRLDPSQQRHAIGTWQAQIAEHQIRLPAFQQRHRLLGAGHGSHAEFTILQFLDQQLTQAIVVFHHQHPLRCAVIHLHRHPPHRPAPTKYEMPRHRASSRPVRSARRTQQPRREPRPTRGRCPDPPAWW